MVAGSTSTSTALNIDRMRRSPRVGHARVINIPARLCRNYPRSHPVVGSPQNAAVELPRVSRRRPWSAIRRAGHCTLFGFRMRRSLVLLAMLSCAATAAVGQPLPDSLSRARSDTLNTALARLLERATRANRLVPAGLAGYRTTAESEITTLARRAEGSEAVAAVEQIASTLSWQRNGAFEQRIVGQRTLAVGAQPSFAGFFQSSYLIPILYGNRLLLFFGAPPPSDSTRRRANARPRQRRDNAAPGTEASRIDSQLVAVHPLAETRDRYYRFSGGDTVVTLQPANGRRVPIVRITVTPRDGLPGRRLVFSGEMDLDASRDQLVRLRGQFLILGPPQQRSLRERLLASTVDALGFFELVNSEVDGKWWIPTYQRFDGQIVSPLLTEARLVFRIVTRFTGVQPIEQPVDTAVIAAGDTLRREQFRISLAPRDSLGAFGDWSRAIGALSIDARTEDFDDVAPDRFRLTGRPVFVPQAERLSDLLRVNRIEGAYLGAAGTLRLRDVAPGVTVRGVAGVSLAEPALRGRLTLERRRNRWLTEARATRGLDITNKFRQPLDSGSVLASLFGVDPYDYVDRWGLTVGAGRLLDRYGSLARIDVGRIDDQAVTANFPARRIASGRVRPNRGIDPGQYWRTTAVLQWRPDINAEFSRPGVGALVQFEQGAGALSYRRLEARAIGRKNWTRLIWTSRVDVGAVFSDRPPPQQLFEIGRTQNLPGYGVKEFAGDRAAVARTLALLPFGILKAPIRLSRALLLPGLDPGISFGMQAGWTEASSPAARAAVRRLGGTTDSSGQFTPFSRPSDGWRASIDVRLRFFNGAVGLGMARPVDRSAPWRFIASFGQQL
jgi:hypothetical protein